MRALVVGALAAALTLEAPIATAQQPPTSPSSTSAGAAAAEALFTEARGLLDKGDIEAACTKFEESHRLDPTAMGTLFNLALCNEKRGRLATAWLQHREVVTTSRTTRADRAALAQARLDALEPRLTRLRIRVPTDAAVDGLEVTLDGVVLPASTFGTALPIDGGEHVVRATANGYLEHVERLRAPPEIGRLEVVVPRLARAPQPPPPLNREGARAGAREPTGSPPSTLGWVLGGAGVASLAVGAGFGVSVFAQSPSLKDESIDWDQRQHTYRSLQTQSWVANIALPVGAILTGIGAYLLLSRSETRSPTVAAAVRQLPAEHDRQILRGLTEVGVGHAR